MIRQPIILFDGDCLFCNKSVRFIIKHDPGFHYTFATLQGEVGFQLKKAYNIPNNKDTLILIENHRYYDASTAALRISRKLTGIYKLAVLFLIVPKRIRDAVYHFIAKRRHRFGKQTACHLPTPEEQERYLDS